MTGRLFIDTGAFLARALVSDAHHRESAEMWDRLAVSPTKLYSSEHVFDETITLLSRRASYEYGAQWGSIHLASRQIQWLSATKADLRGALAWMRKYADQSVSFTDCLSFELMRRENIKEAFAFDKHFLFAGFRLAGG